VDIAGRRRRRGGALRRSLDQRGALKNCHPRRPFNCIASILRCAPGRADNAHPASDCGGLDEAEKAFGGLVMPRRDAPGTLEQAQPSLDAGAPCKAAPVDGRRRPHPVSARRARDPISTGGSKSGAAAIGQGVRCEPSGNPFAPGGTWVLVEAPPLDRPNAFKWKKFLAPRCACVPDRGAVGHLKRRICGAACSNRRHALINDPGARSLCEPAQDRRSICRSAQPSRARAIGKMPSKVCRLPSPDARRGCGPTAETARPPPCRVGDEGPVQGRRPMSSLDSRSWRNETPRCSDRLAPQRRQIIGRTRQVQGSLWRGAVR
jgi:hypothetical protein